MKGWFKKWLQRRNGSTDWVVWSLIFSVLLAVIGIVFLVWMFANREYWRNDPEMPHVFVMFSRVINGSTIGVMCLFIGAIIAAYAIMSWFIRYRTEDLFLAMAIVRRDVKLARTEQEELRRLIINLPEAIRQGGAAGATRRGRKGFDDSPNSSADQPGPPFGPESPRVLALDVSELKLAVAELRALAANESQVYLRGVADGSDAGGTPT